MMLMRTFLQPDCYRGPSAKVRGKACLFPFYGLPSISLSTGKAFDSGGFIEQLAGIVTSCFGKYKRHEDVGQLSETSHCFFF